MSFHWIKLKESDKEWTIAERTENGLFWTGPFGQEIWHVFLVGPMILPPTYVKQVQRIPAEVFDKPEVENATDVIEPKVLQRDPMVLPIKEFVESKRTKDCPIVALANVMQISYKEAHVLCFHHGWASTRGISRGFLEVILEKHGYELSFIEEFVGKRVCDLASIRDGTFLVYVNQHVMPCFGNTVHNVQEQDSEVINDCFEVFKAETETVKEGKCYASSI